MQATRALLLVLSITSLVRAQAPTTLPPAPGRLIDVGGRKLHLLCSGQGEPTVVLEAGASSFAIDWTFVQREVSRTNRTCSYDRAGSGWLSRYRSHQCCLPHSPDGVGTRVRASFRGSITPPAHPLSTLRRQPRDHLRMTRGQDGFATSFPV